MKINEQNFFSMIVKKRKTYTSVNHMYGPIFIGKPVIVSVLLSKNIYGVISDVMICEWALDNGYVSYVSTNAYDAKYVGDVIISQHTYSFTEKGFELCCILDL
jgi:hypothetical protein